MMRRVLRSLSIAFACVFLVAVTRNLETTTAATPDRPVAYNAPLPHTIHGHGTQSVGNLRIPPNTVLHWSCPECGPATAYWAGSTFQVFNDQSDPQLLLSGINALGKRSGVEVVNGGTYHDVFVETATGGWTISFSREPARP